MGRKLPCNNMLSKHFTYTYKSTKLNGRERRINVKESMSKNSKTPTQPSQILWQGTNATRSAVSPHYPDE